MKIDTSCVTSVYSGKNHACMCGCKGKYTYSSKQAEIAKKRGGAVNDRVVRIMVSKIEACPDAIVKDGYVEAVIGDRVYVAYTSER